MTAAGLVGVSHLGLSVADLDAAVAFWAGPMGFDVVDRTDEYCFLLHRDALVAIVLSDHSGAVSGSFDELRPGLDHLALAVADAESLHAWVARLDAASVQHSGIAETDAGLHLNLRGPDRFPVELFVLSPAMADHMGLHGEVAAAR